MLVPFLAAAIVSAGMVDGGHHCSRRPIATAAPYPAGLADDVRRPGFNGRMWVSRPILGARQEGPYAVDEGSPGSEAYGAFDHANATVYARVGHIFVGVSPWQSINQGGLKRLEAARNFWLKEQGYTGGVRTMINDAYLWKVAPPAPADQHAGAEGVPLPRATITLPADLPRQHRRLRVDAGEAARGVLAGLPGVGQARISWPAGGPAAVVARSETRGSFVAEPPPRVITQAR